MKGSEGEGEREEGRERCSMGHVVRRARDNQCGDVTVYPTNRGIAPFKPGSLGLRVESRRVPSGFSPTAVRPRSLRRANSRLDPSSFTLVVVPCSDNNVSIAEKFGSISFKRSYVQPFTRLEKSIVTKHRRVHASFLSMKVG